MGTFLIVTMRLKNKLAICRKASRAVATGLIFAEKNGMSNDPLHGKTLEAILTELVHHFGWEHLADIVRINCFISNPSINSSLKFLRKTPWARKKVEDLYIKTIA